MTKPHKVKVYDEQGNLIREGAPRVMEKKFWDFSVSELGRWLGLVVIAFMLVSKIDARVQKVELTQEQTKQTEEIMSKGLAKIIDFIKNSDGYHGAVTGTQFENGRPLNSNFDTKKIRDFITQ